MTFTENLRRLKKMPPNILIKKIYKRIHRNIYHKLREPKVIGNKIRLDNKPFEHWTSSMNQLFNVENKKYYNEFLENKEVANNILKSADKICDHIFDLLGSGDVHLGKKIKWNQDFKTGFIWENKYYNKIITINLENNSDVKVPWELSRFQHIPTLGQAYWLTSNEKYSVEFESQIISWIEENPFEMSVNWTSAMDVAIRACNWILGAFYFKSSRSLDKQFWIRFNKSLYMHGLFIYNNLEKGEVNNNHYISDLVGLVWLGLYFKELQIKNNNAEKWINLGMSELEIEIEKQVYNDGFNYEASTAYHCLVTELFLYTSIICDRNKIEFSDSYKLKLEKMIEVINNITKPNGLIPQVGDMDSGRFVIFSDYGSNEKRDFRHLLEVAGEYFKRKDFKRFHSKQITALWLFDKLNEVKKSSADKNLNSITYPEGGIHIIRKDKIYLLIRCGQVGTLGRGGHSHNDQLSVELNIGGEDFIVDPGTYVYTSDYKMRNKFRSTCYHNTLQIGDLEQNDIGENLFQLGNQSNAKVLDFGEIHFAGEHYGFRDKSRVIKHKREIIIDDSRQVEISDYVDDDFGISKCLNFIISPDVTVNKENEEVILGGKKHKVRMKFTDASRIDILDKHYSSAYGNIEETKTIEVEFKNNRIKTSIEIEDI